MSYNDLPGFQVVEFKTERDGALKDLDRAKPLLSTFATDHATFLFRVTQVVGTKIYLTAIEQSREAKTHEELRFVFSLSTGQYALVGRLEFAAGANSVLLDFSKVELLRLQRRDSFRIVLPVGVPLTFYLNKKIKPEYAIKVNDVSLGGMAVVMPPDHIESYWVGSSIKGSLVLSGRDPIELEGVIRHHFPKDAFKHQKMGVQFSEITGDIQRELLSLTLQLHREINKKESS
jgi:hypothetical protein